MGLRNISFPKRITRHVMHKDAEKMATNSNSGKTYYKTGETVPVKGTYRLARHIDSTTCSPSEIERQIPLSVGETFPPYKSCKTDAYWSLEKFG
jgi:hypothetical protein